MVPPAAKPPMTSSRKPTSEYKAIAAQFAAAERVKTKEQIDKEKEAIRVQDKQREALEARRKSSFENRWLWNAGFWVWMLVVHVVGIGYFTSGFLLTRLMLDEKSVCGEVPTGGGAGGGYEILSDWKGKGTVEGGCWHPRVFEKAVVVVIDALRYDFTVPVGDGALFHDRFPFMYETARRSPQHAFLRPFIADPPTATLQRLKGLTTGTLPTFVDVGSSFSGTAIEEDNLLTQLREAGKRIVHLGDDTWDALFPGHFEGNLSRSYDSFNVWDLHTVDNGVVEHIFPLMEMTGEWDVVIGHLLGVDHAGHRYGPAHEEMGKKLEQMDRFIGDLAGKIDDKTVLIVMGDHGMDGKGDHGGESDDEVEAALWMYSKKPMFGRTKPEFVTPPATAKVRPLNQIDFVPTLAMMLGIPIPYNNLGRPIEEVFVGPNGRNWDNLAAAERTTAAGIKRYQGSYFEARGIVQAATPGSPAELWAHAEGLLSSKGLKGQDKWAAVHGAFAAYQEETLKRCKSLWASFDMKKMALGIAIMAFGVVSLLTYVSKGFEDDDEAILENAELDLAEKKLEMQGVKPATETVPGGDLDRRLVRGALLGFLPVFFGGLLQSYLSGAGDWYRGAGFGALTSIVMVMVVLFDSLDVVLNLVPTTFWGWLAVVFTVSQSVGFASNSFTIWEDSILLFFIATFGFASALSALRLSNPAERYLSVYNSIMFVILGRLASFSKLCREEQMPYCTSTYYASATSSTSATWQLVIPFLVFLILPSIVKAYLVPSRSYEGLAPAWIGYVFRTGLLMAALYWVLDAADNGNWFPSLPANTLKSISVYLAQTILGLSLVAGTTAFVWAPPCVSIYTAARQPGQAQVTVLGYGNAHGARYLLLPLNILAACFLLSKPMGGGALGLMMWQILALVEILDYNSLTTEAIGPIMLALLGNFYFFKTGHQAVLSTIQWDSAFIPLFSIRYPWSPVVVAFNTFGGQILAVTTVPLLVLWKVGPSRKGLLTRLSRSFGIFVGYFAVEALASMMWAGHLRRHLMLYRVFCPRFMTAAVVLVVVDVFGLLVGLAGFRCNSLAVGEVFGWAE